MILSSWNWERSWKADWASNLTSSNINKAIFHSLCKEIPALIDQWEPRLSALPVHTITANRNRQDRTVKQIVGHMVDSATNNTHRIIHLQYQENPVRYPDYANLGNNDRWIAIQNYQEEEWNLLVRLWAS